MVQRFWKLSDWPNWPVLCLYRPPAKTPVRTQNLPHKYYAPNFWDLLWVFLNPSEPRLTKLTGSLVQCKVWLSSQDSNPPKRWEISSFPGIFQIHIYYEIIMLKVNLVHSEVPKIDWPNWRVLCLYRPPAKTPVGNQNLPQKHYEPNFSQNFFECPFTLWY